VGDRAFVLSGEATVMQCPICGGYKTHYQNRWTIGTHLFCIVASAGLYLLILIPSMIYGLINTALGGTYKKRWEYDIFGYVWVPSWRR
jgi:hypothetical protein